jgi:hypothetical protein
MKRIAMAVAIILVTGQAAIAEDADKTFQSLMNVAQMCEQKVTECGDLFKKSKVSIGGIDFDAVEIGNRKVFKVEKAFGKIGLLCHCEDCVSVPPKVSCGGGLLPF